MKRSQKVYIQPSDKKWILGNVLDGLRLHYYHTSKASHIREHGTTDCAEYQITVTLERVKKKKKVKIGKYHDNGAVPTNPCSCCL